MSMDFRNGPHDALLSLQNKVAKQAKRIKELEEQGGGGGDAPDLQDKSVSFTPSETAQSQTVRPDAGKDGLSSVAVSVGAISTTYVGSDITRRSSSDMTASGATVTAPAGYYSSAASKAVASGSASTPATTITANPSISVSASGLITATASGSKSITPSVSAGYVSSGTAGTVSVSGSNTEQLSTQAAKTVTPTTSQQTAVAAGKYTTGAVTVGAIPSEYIIPSGSETKTANGTYNVTSLAEIVVDVPTGGGASNFVIGTFTTGSSTGTTGSISVPYTGSGFPLAAMVFVSSGAYNSANTAWYNSTHRYAVGQWTYHNAQQSSSCNTGVTTWVFKNSTSSATTYSRSSAMNTTVRTSSAPTGAGATCVRMTTDGKTLKWYVSSTSYGLLAETEYKYIIIYST